MFPESVARLIAGISNWRAATVVNITKAIHKALEGFDSEDSTMAKPEEKSQTGKRVEMLFESACERLLVVGTETGTLQSLQKTEAFLRITTL